MKSEMNSTPLLSVCICTWNRSQSLSRTLNSLVKAAVQFDCKWELIVVNNNSTDDTDKVVQSFEDRLPIKVIHEKNSGLANARNAAVDAATGEYIVWTDDDVVVGVQWLNAYANGFRDHPEIALFGGPIKAMFDGVMPKWLADGWSSAHLPFCENDLGNREFALSANPVMLPYGANFAVRRLEQLRVQYNPELGAGPNNRYHGEETTVMVELLESGSKGIWLPTAVVEHMNGSDRMNLAYIKKYYIKSGQTQIRLEPKHEGLYVHRRPTWLWRMILETYCSYLWSRLRKSPAVWLKIYVKHAIALGKFYELGKTCAQPETKNK
ncbi:MAG: glycosyltransferase family 2 protein [Candidatus Saccharibacteria bacterium]|nr:glycosyltransferase family 2 protein [Moraxellaceae bacterium]